MIPKFRLGLTVATPGALDLLRANNVEARALLKRHIVGDWGNVCKDDKRENDWSLANDARLLSSYPVGDGKVWVITESDRSATTILLPEDY